MSDITGPDDEALDNLTEFEYALAGVSSSDAEGNPAIRVVGDMRRLMSSVRQTPVRSPGLMNFLDDNQGERRNDRRGLVTPSSKRDRPPQTSGGFVDITPRELLGDPDPIQNDVADFEPDAVAIPTDSDQLDDHEISRLNPDHSPVDEIPDSPTPSDSEEADESVDSSQSTELDDDPADGSNTEHTFSEFTETSEQPQIAPNDSLPSDAEDEVTAEHDVPADFVETRPIVSVVDPSERSEPSLFDTDLARAAVNAANPNPTVLEDSEFPDLEPSSAPASEYGSKDVMMLPQLAAVTFESKRDKSRRASFVWIGAVAAAIAIVVGGLWIINRTTVTTDENALETSDIGADSEPDLGLNKQPGESAGENLNSEQESQAKANQGQSSEFSKSSPSTSEPSETSLVGSDGDNDALTLSESTISASGSPTSTTPTTDSTSATRRQSAVTASSTVTTRSQTTRQPTTTIRQTTARPTTTRQTTIKQTTTARPTTTSQQTTTRPPSTTPPFAYLGNKVYLDQRFGAVATQASIELHFDADGDGTPEGLIVRRDLNDSGTYEFEVNAGCFVVRVVPFSGYELVPGNGDLPVCVEPGQTNNNLDSVIRKVNVFVDPPSACYVEVRDSNLDNRGVRITEDDRQFRFSYTLFDNSGRVVVETKNVPTDDIYFHNANTREWEDQGNYNSQVVFSAAATDSQGNVSTTISCQR